MTRKEYMRRYNKKHRKELAEKRRDGKGWWWRAVAKAKEPFEHAQSEWRQEVENDDKA